MTDPITLELQRRAERLARPPAPESPADIIDVVVFSWDGATYLLPTAWARETVEIRGVALVPGSRPPLLGACTARSQLLPVIDLRPLCGRPAATRAVQRVVVVDDRSRTSLAIAIDEAHRIARVRAFELHDPPDRHPAIRAVTSQGASLLDPDWLLALPNFFSACEGSPS